MKARDRIVAELRLIADAVPRSEFFANHEIVGSSVLHVVDAEGRVTCKVIDLGKTVPSRVRLTHDIDVAKTPLGSQEEGYLLGLRSLIATWESI
jgi:1D-myo-inositol-triphosphate 3-kinase